jgi:hypothetical protein
MKSIGVLAAIALIAGSGTSFAQSNFEQYLIPSIATDVPGAFGSIWRSDFAFFNAGAAQHTVLGPFCDPAAPGCGKTPIALDAGVGTIPPLISQFPQTDGGFLYVSKPAAEVISSFRVRDLSRQAQTWGTEVPIVSVNSFRQRIDLVNIPTDSRFRLTLRIYSANPALARVHIISFPGQTELSVQDVVLAAPPTLGQALNLSPAYARITLPPISGADQIRLEVEQVLPGGAPIWAFATVTNNDTQQVTAVTPQGDVGAVHLASGHWAGNFMCVDVGDAQIKVVYECAVGTFGLPIVASDGHFDADGTWTISLGPQITTLSAHLSGLMQGSSLTVTIREGSSIVGPISVQLGSQGPCGAVCP